MIFKSLHAEADRPLTFVGQVRAQASSLLAGLRIGIAAHSIHTASGHRKAAMRLAAAALALALSAERVTSFVPACPTRSHQITGDVGATATAASTSRTASQLSRLHQRPRFVEEDFYFEEDEYEDDGDEGDDYSDRSRTAPAARRQRPPPSRQRQRQPREDRRRRDRDVDLGSPTARRQSSGVKENLGTIALEEDIDSQESTAMATTGSTAPIVPSRNGRRSNYREEEEDDEWDDEFDDDDFDDEFDDDDYYDEEDDEKSSGGNFWTNPEGGLDPYPSSERRRKSTARGRMPPSTAEPQPDTKPRGRSRSQSRERRANGGPVDAYGRPPPSRRRPGAIQKTTFRSGTPPPPPLMKGFYDRFFWYGFDPRETTSPTDRTMFGGTKGKFSGLDVLREVDGKPASRRGPRGERMREREEYDEDDEWDDFDDEYDDYSDDNFDNANDGAIIPKPLLPGLSIEEKRSSRPPPPRSRRRQENRRPREPRAPRNDRLGSNDEDDDYDDIYNSGRAKSSRRRKEESRISSRNRGRSRKGRFDSNSEWAADEVSSWFNDDDNVIDLWPSRFSNNDDDDEYWRDDSRSRRGRKGDRRSGRRRKAETPPLLDFVESVFGMDSSYIDEKAQEYEEKIGRAKPSLKRRSSRGRPVRNEVSRRRRAGYAYRYEDDDNDSPPVAEFAPSRKSNTANGDVIDVPAGKMIVRRNGNSSASARQKKKRRKKRPSWEDRESEELDRIPPAGITAYGPEGDVMGGIDARTYAALKASEEIRGAKRKIAAREERVIDAEERILMLKADVEEQKMIFAQSRQSKSPRVRDAVRQMNMMVEDAARSLRKSRAELDVAIDAMEELEDRHWVLLSQVASDEEFARLDAEAEREEEGEEVVPEMNGDEDSTGTDPVDTEAATDVQPENEDQDIKEEKEDPKAEVDGEPAKSEMAQDDKNGDDEKSEQVE